MTWFGTVKFIAFYSIHENMALRSTDSKIKLNAMDKGEKADFNDNSWKIFTRCHAY